MQVRQLDAPGAPFDQGATQGRTFADALRALAHEQDLLAGGWLQRRSMARAARRGPALAMLRYTLQLHERLQGIAAGARLGVARLELLATLTRTSGVASVSGSELESRLDLAPELESLLLLRRSAPDAVGLRTLELCTVALPGCIAGLNERGVGLVVLRDRDIAQIPLHALAQDTLTRATDLDAALAHVELRAFYAGGTGEILLADATGRAVQVVLEAGRFTSRPVVARSHPVAESTLRLDLRAAALTYCASDGSEHRVELGKVE